MRKKCSNHEELEEKEFLAWAKKMLSKKEYEYAKLYITLKLYRQYLNENNI